jgi:hypothetical protein
MTTIAMWSGPRNISTAMMYSFAARADCAVWDEPFYAHYLATTGIIHPMGDEVIATGETSYDKVVEMCLAPPPGGKTVFYQKHMTHHMLPGQDWQWCLPLTNVFLIRSPERVLASYSAKREDVALADIGFERQLDLFNMVADNSGQAPAVIDCDDILADPAAAMAKLCSQTGISFDAGMLKWSPGPKSFDGVWAKHWYNAVWKSSGFSDPKSGYPELEPRLAKIADEAHPIYEQLSAHRLAM